jgi:hypothetical protein
VNMVDSPDKPAKTKATVKSQKAVTKKVVPWTSTREPKEKTNHIKALAPIKVLEFVRVSNDKKYDVYSYTFQLQTGWSVWWVKNKVRQELWNKARGKTIIIVDKLGNEIKKDRHFDKWEKVRVRVWK